MWTSSPEKLLKYSFLFIKPHYFMHTSYVFKFQLLCARGLEFMMQSQQWIVLHARTLLFHQNRRTTDDGNLGSKFEKKDRHL